MDENHTNDDEEIEEILVDPDDIDEEDLGYVPDEDEEYLSELHKIAAECAAEKELPPPIDEAVAQKRAEENGDDEEEMTLEHIDNRPKGAMLDVGEESKRTAHREGAVEGSTSFVDDRQMTDTKQTTLIHEESTVDDDTQES